MIVGGREGVEGGPSEQSFSCLRSPDTPILWHSLARPSTNGYVHLDQLHWLLSYFWWYEMTNETCEE
jgi:hypothetical protein